MASPLDWKKAVIHLECAMDRKSIEERLNEQKGLWAKLDAKEISFNQYSEEVLHISSEARDMRSRGTALFMEHESRKYLLTARHVVDKTMVRRLCNLPIDSYDRDRDSIFSIIFRLPNLDEKISTIPEFLMNLGAGVSWMSPYTFSSNPDVDLAIISLDQRDSRFVNELLEHGYRPITSSDISEEPSAEGGDIYTIGFPDAISVLGSVSIPPSLLPWSSSSVSLPAYAYGKVSMLHNELSFFWGDISIFPGNSGGPVIENGKLVGIVSKQPVIAAEGQAQIGIRVPFAKITKSKYISELLERQIEKDNASNM
ncbi:MAG: serine protease [Euryarchaeota archaeon]|nr:serine protease [Euryarchaeota archaeon]